MSEQRVRLLKHGEGTALIVLGTTQHIKLTGTDTAGAYTLVEEAGPVGSGVPLHVHHNEDETFFVLSGTFKFIVGGDTIIAEVGTTLFAPRDVPHSMEVVSDTVGRVLTLISPPGLEHMFEALSRLPEDVEMAQAIELCRRFDVEFL